MKKIILILLMIILSGCHHSSQSGEILSETFHYYDVIEGKIDQKNYSECKEYRNGQVVKAYKISSDNEIYNEKDYKYKGDLLLSTKIHNGSYKTEVKNEYKINQLIASYFYRDGELTGKTLFEYDGDTKTTSFYDDKDIFQKTIETRYGCNVYSETIFYHYDLSVIIEYVLDENDNPIKKVENTEYEVTISEFSYDNFGNQLTLFRSTEETKERESQGNLNEVYNDTLIEYEYVYDEHDQYTEKKMYMNGELVWYETKEIIYQE